ARVQQGIDPASQDASRFALPEQRKNGCCELRRGLCSDCAALEQQQRSTLNLQFQRLRGASDPIDLVRRLAKTARVSRPALDGSRLASSRNYGIRVIWQSHASAPRRRAIRKGGPGLMDRYICKDRTPALSGFRKVS